MKKKICLVFCRKDSKRLKNKNLALFLGKPLLYYTYKNIKKSKLFDRIILSTDGKKIAQTGKKLGFEVPGLRPKRYAKEKSNVFDAHNYIFKKLLLNDKNSIVCIVNNNPFINSKLLNKTYKIYKKFKYKYITTLARPTSTDEVYYRQFKKNNKKIIPLFKKKLIKSKINSNQTEKTFYNLGEIRWASIKLLSSFKKYNENLSIKGNKFYLIDRDDYYDIHTHKDLKLSETLFKLNKL